MWPMVRAWRRAGMVTGSVVSAVIGTLVVSAVYPAVASPSRCVGARGLGYCMYSISPLWYVVGAVAAIALFLGLVAVVFASTRVVFGRGARPPDQ